MHTRTCRLLAILFFTNALCINLPVADAETKKKRK